MNGCRWHRDLDLIELFWTFEPVWTDICPRLMNDFCTQTPVLRGCSFLWEARHQSRGRLRHLREALHHSSRFLWSPRNCMRADWRHGNWPVSFLFETVSCRCVSTSSHPLFLLHSSFYVRECALKQSKVSEFPLLTILRRHDSLFSGRAN